MDSTTPTSTRWPPTSATKPHHVVRLVADSGLVTEEYLDSMAHKYFAAQSIVIGHANFPPVTHVYGQLVDIIRERNLALVTLNDVLQVQA